MRFQPCHTLIYSKYVSQVVWMEPGKVAAVQKLELAISQGLMSTSYESPQERIRTGG